MQTDHVVLHAQSHANSLFTIPCHAEKYLREVWPAVTRCLKEHGLSCELNLVGCPGSPHHCTSGVNILQIPEFYYGLCFCGSHI